MNSDDKIVSISFDNRQFLDDVSSTIKALEALNDATSGKNLSSQGITDLTTSFNNLGASAANNITNIQNGLNDTSAFNTLNESVQSTANEFSSLEIVAIGALMEIGSMAIDVGQRALGAMTQGIRDGWSEYNILIDATQTILTNTKKYGTTIDDVTASLDELNEYADKTIYNFGQMTRNMGYFTTQGLNLDTAQETVMGMSNLAAMFGSTNESLQRAMYQTSQAYSAGFIRLMDWRSLANATMGGDILKEELIRTAALMSGKTFEEMNEAIEQMGGWEESLRYKWLTTDIFTEAMRRFAGMTREEAAAIRDINDNPLSEEEINRIVQLGEDGLEAAQKVRTLHQMIEAVKESIGSGWAQTFRLIIGDLEQAKEFWSPINETITSVINGISDYRNDIVRSWAIIYRELMVEDLQTAMTSLKEVLEAIGRGFAKAFGSPREIARKIGLITEAIGDLSYTLRLDEEELQDITDLVAGLVAPFTLILDVIVELSRAFFNAGDAMNEFDTRTNSLADAIRPIRKRILDILGLMGRIISKIVDIIRHTGLIQRAIRIVGGVIRGLADIIYNSIGLAIIAIKNIWERYNITDKLMAFYDTFMTYIVSLKDPLLEVAGVFAAWFGALKSALLTIDFTPLKDIKIIIDGLIDVFNALVDPTISVSEAINKFKNSIKQTSIYKYISLMKIAFVELFNVLKETRIGQALSLIGDQTLGLRDKIFIVIDGIQNAFSRFKSFIRTTSIPEYFDNFKNKITQIYEAFKRTRVGKFIIDLANSIKDAISVLKENLEGTVIGDTITNFVDTIRNTFAVDEELKEPNVFTLVKDVINKVKDVVDDVKNVSLEPIENVIDTVKTVTDKAKDVLYNNIPEELITKAAEGNEKFLNVIGSVVDLTDDIASLALGHDDLEAKITAVSERLSFLSSSDRENDVSKLEKITSIVDLILKAIRTLVVNFAAFSLLMIALNNSISLKAVAKAIENFSGAFGQWAKSRKYKAISDIFNSIFKLTAAIVLGVYLLSTIEDTDKVAKTLEYLTGSIVMILGVCILGITLIMLTVNRFVSTTGSLSGLKNAAELSTIMVSISRFLNQIMWFVIKIAIVARVVANMTSEQQEVFFKVVRVLMNTFLLLAGGVAVITGVIFFFSRSLDEIDSTAKLFNSVVGIRTTTIEAAANAMATITKAISGLMLAFAVSAALIMLVAPDMGTLIATGVILGLFFAGVTVALGFLMAWTTGFNEARIAALESFVMVLNHFSIFLLSLGASLSLVIGSIAILSAVLHGMSGGQIAAIALIIGVLMAGILLIVSQMYSVSVAFAHNTAKTTDMLIIAGSLMMVTTCVVAIMNALSLLSGLMYIKGYIVKVLATLTIMVLSLAGLAGVLLALGALGKKFYVFPADLMMIAGSLMMVSSALIIISTALLMITSIPIDKLVPAAYVVGVFFSVIAGMMLAFGALTAINPAVGGLVGGMLILVATAMIMMSTAVLQLGAAMAVGAKGVKTFAEALSILQNVDGSKILDNIKYIFRSIPEFLGVIVANFATIKTIIFETITTIGQGISEIITTIFGTINGLIVQFLSQGIYVFIGLIDEIFPVILTSIHNNLVLFKDFIAAECSEGGTLRELIVNLGDFLVWAAGYLATFSVDIVASIIDGLVTALSHTYVVQKLSQTIAGALIELRYRIWQMWGIASWSDFGSLIGEAIVTGFMNSVSAVQSWYSGFMANIANGLADMAEAAGDTDAAAIHRATAEQYQSEADAYQQQIEDNNTSLVNFVGDLTEQNRAAMEAEMAGWEAVVAESEESYNRLRNGYDTAASDVYDPSEYYAHQAGNQDYHKAGEESGNAFSTGFANRIANFFTGGQSIRELLGLDSFGIDSLFDVGEESGNGFFGGLTDSLSVADNVDLSGLSTDITEISNHDLSNLEDLDNVQNIDDKDFSGLSDALKNAGQLPEDVKNPVIAPTVDVTGVETGFNTISDLWNQHNFDEFAIDAGTSMLFRERADGDAASNGDVTYAYTQYNYSPEALSPIQIYRDTKNLIRGHIK